MVVQTFMASHPTVAEMFNSGKRWKAGQYCRIDVQLKFGSTLQRLTKIQKYLLFVCGTQHLRRTSSFEQAWVKGSVSLQADCQIQTR